MAFSTTVLAVTLLVVVGAFRWALTWRQHVREARASGLACLVVPAYYFSIPWLLGQGYILPYIRKLPQSWQGTWIDAVTSGWGYIHGYKLFDRIGSDTFIAAAPGKSILYSADADVIAQIATRRLDFPKPVELHLYKRLSFYGINTATTEGEVWRHHRKIVTPSFSDRSNALVFTESIRQAHFMIRSWEQRGSVVSAVTDDTLRLSLHVISRAGFGIKNVWPGLEDGIEGEQEQDVLDAEELQLHHSMTFMQAMEGVLDHLLQLLIIPLKVMSRLPFKTMRDAYRCHTEWTQYLEDLYSIKLRNLTSGTHTNDTRSFDLMGNMILESLPPTSSPDTKFPSPTAPTTGLNKSEIVGNAFIFLNAGHETSAHTIQMSILHLAIYPHIQRRLQSSLDAILGTRPPASWSYETDFPQLADSWPGAVMNESLRLCPSVLNIPKIVPPGGPQMLKVNGHDHPIAEGTFVWLAVAAVGRNPKYWLGEHGELDPRDLDEWRAERWMHGQLDTTTSHDAGDEGEQDDVGEAKQRDVEERLFRPRKGAFIPFSEGKRSCIGQRFARTEIVAVLAAVFKEWSVELVVPGDEQGLSFQERRERFETAREKAVRTIKDGCRTGPTLRLRKGEIPVRLVKRGEERWGDM
ncbi:Cytochrome P450-like protein 68 [Elsinoe fawcettii]|nr:Cytochrome P450-like protein 68 [Elsinoe fawcettii]